ncbi:MAG: hypothetical protein CM15mP40_12750 [Alphaproteobacteria bacterium]|nr:MAG: hypothetical protein CM15mP40_12750 [Alphaproteobacteria bacterium]
MEDFLKIKQLKFYIFPNHLRKNDRALKPLNMYVFWDEAHCISKWGGF